MTERKPDYTGREDWNVADIPEVTDKDFGRMRPARETHPDIVKAYEQGRLRRRGPQKTPTKVATTIRLDPAVVDYFKSGGRGWQTRIMMRCVGRSGWIERMRSGLALLHPPVIAGWRQWSARCRSGYSTVGKCPA